MKGHQVYRNLHNGKWSVQDRSTKSVRVAFHADSVLMLGCSFVVQPAGIVKVRRERKKHVHAFVRGEYGGSAANIISSSVAEGRTNAKDWVKVCYDPYRYFSFVRADSEKPVTASAMVTLNQDGTLMAYLPT
jgi:hypothetical protein